MNTKKIFPVKYDFRSYLLNDWIYHRTVECLKFHDWVCYDVYRRYLGGIGNVAVVRQCHRQCRRTENDGCKTKEKISHLVNTDCDCRYEGFVSGFISITVCSYKSMGVVATSFP